MYYFICIPQQSYGIPYKQNQTLTSNQTLDFVNAYVKNQGSPVLPLQVDCVLEGIRATDYELLSVLSGQ